MPLIQVSTNMIANLPDKFAWDKPYQFHQTARNLSPGQISLDGAFILDGYGIRHARASTHGQDSISLCFNSREVTLVFDDNIGSWDDHQVFHPQDCRVEVTCDGKPVPAQFCGEDLTNNRYSSFLLMSEVGTVCYIIRHSSGVHILRLSSDSPYFALTGLYFGPKPGAKP